MREQIGTTAPKAPLWITPLFEEKIDEGSCYRTVKKLVTKIPNPFCADTATSGQIETSLDEYLEPNDDVLWRRVAVRGYDGGIDRGLHASFTIPNDNSILCTPTSSDPHSLSDENFAEHSMCWASFLDNPEHKLLCVLLSPLLLHIWDVYPFNGNETGESIGGGEGHSVTLPFEARGIFALTGYCGLIIQRRQTIEDRLIDEVLKGNTWVYGGGLDGDDGGFVLQDPPRPVRLGTVLMSPTDMEMTIAQPSPATTASVEPVPSLLTLKHPLDELRPVTKHEGSSYPFFSNVNERILFVGAPTWTEHKDSPYDNKEYTESICVTYNCQQKRHAVWLIHNAPPPAPTPPLWQVSRAQRDGNVIGDEIPVIHDPQVMPEGNFGPTGISDPDWRGTTSRQDALADALGVRSSKKPEDPVGSRVRGGDRSRRSGELKTASFTPPPITLRGAGGNESKGELHVETSHYTHGMSKIAPHVFSPFADLTPEYSLTLLFEEDAKTNTGRAINVFLASNIEASGTLTICLVCPKMADETGVSPSELRWLSLVPRRVKHSSAVAKRRHTFSILTKVTGPCVSAQPVQAAPAPLCFVPSGRNSSQDSKVEVFATDVLVLEPGPARRVTRRSKAPNRMFLYRSGVALAECAMPTPSLSRSNGSHDKNETASVIAIEYPVADCIDYLCSDKAGGHSSVRGKICLRFPSSPMADAALAALDACFFFPCESGVSKESVDIALRLRVDCVRLAQAVTSTRSSLNLRTESNCWPAVECVSSSFIETFLSDSSGDSVTAERLARAPFENDDYWSMLLDSDFDATYRAEDSSALFFGFNEDHESHRLLGRSREIHRVLTSVVKPAWLTTRSASPLNANRPALAYRVFDALHLLYEESKLSSYRSWLRPLGSLLARVCIHAGTAQDCSNTSNNCMSDFLDHYQRDLGSRWLEEMKRTTKMNERVNGARRVVTLYERPPCFLEWVEALLKRFGTGERMSTTNFYDMLESSKIPPAFRISRALHRAFTSLFGEDVTTADQSQRDRLVIDILIQEGMDNAIELRDELPAGLALPILEVLYRCRGDPQICSIASWSSGAWLLLGRTDVSKKCNGRQSYVPRALNVKGTRYKELLADPHKDGIQPTEVTSSLFFPDDNRVHQVGKMLGSSRPMYLQIERPVELSDHEYERAKQETLKILCRRTFAVPLGRGMLTFGNLKPIPAEPLPVPTLCLSGRVPPTNNTLALDTSSSPADIKVWPEFHNGVAAGLRLPSREEVDEATARQISRTWIAYNRTTNEAASSLPQNHPSNDSTDPPTPTSHTHGGLLMALGLRGHLSTLMMTDIYEYLTQGVVTTTVGILLGMAANRRGSCDPLVSKMLCLHIPSLLPASFTAMDVAGPAQAAAVAGIGLLYQGSSHRLMTEFLLEELGKRPTNDSITVDREAYTLSCGIALGMVNLAKGNKSTGGSDGDNWYGLADLDLDGRLHRFVVGGVDGNEQQRRREAADRFSSTVGMSSNDNERCSRVFEGDTINTDVTAPGATLAIGLVYMKSGNNAVASSIALPDTHFLLEYVRPDMLLFRVVSRALILWDDVKPSCHWIDDQIPLVVKATYDQMRAAVEKLSGDFDILTGSGRSRGAESASDDDTAARPNHDSSIPLDESIDRQAVRQIYVHVVAGACFGMGLRYAGTGDKEAAAAITEKLTEMKCMRDGSSPVSAALRPEIPILDMCIGCVAVSLAMVLAGTGDLPTFRLLRLLRWRCHDDTRYGTHMAYGAAIGLLFVGGGSSTLGRSPEDIAALVLAFFPRFPSTMSDNQYHLQALRHCYALAVVKREIKAIDSDTGEVVSVPIEIDYLEDDMETTKATAPCLLLNTNGTPRTLRVSSNRYYPLTLNIDSKSGITFHVKKRNGHLSHSQDPHSQRSLLVHTLSGGHSVSALIESFTENPLIIAYAQYLCEEGVSHKLSWVPEFCSRVLHECLVKDTEEALPLYLKLQSAVEAIKDTFSSQAAWDIRLISAYYEEYRNIVSSSKATRLLSAEFVAMLNEVVEQRLLSTTLDESDVLVYMKSGEARSEHSHDTESQAIVGPFLTWFDVSFPIKTLEESGSADAMEVG